MTDENSGEHGGDPGREAALIERDGYDEAAFQRAMESTAFSEAVEAGTALMPHFKPLVHDIFSLLFKYNVVWLHDERHDEQETKRASQEMARRLLQWIHSTRDFERLKAETTLDEPRSAHACLRLTEGVLAILRDPERFSHEELLEGFEAAGLEEQLEKTRDMLDAIDEIDVERQAVESQTAEDQTGEDQSGEDQETSPQQEGQFGQETGEPAAGATEDGAGKGAASFRRALQDQEAALKRALKALAEAQQRRLDKLPAAVESQMRRTVEELPVEMEAEEEAASQFAGALGVGEGTLDTRAKLDLGRRLLNNEKLARLSRLAGAFREYALGIRRKPFERRATEIHSLETGSSLGRVLPNELVLLRHPTLRRLFMIRLIESGLTQYAIQGRDKAGRGPVVLCLDGSSSMQGAKELWAKAVALTLLELCRRERRPFTAIVFSGRAVEIKQFPLVEPPPRPSVSAPKVDFERLVDFAEYFPRGGTAFQEPLAAAVKIVESDSGSKSDIVLITDGEAAVGRKWQAWFDDKRDELGFKLHSVLVDVGSHRAGVVEDLSDSVTSVTDLTAESAGELFSIV